MTRMLHASVPKVAVSVCHLTLGWMRKTHQFRDLLLIMLTSLAPSPIARVTTLLCLFTSSTTWAFCIGVTRLQMTVLHKQATSSRMCSSSGSRAWACHDTTNLTPLKSHHYQHITSTPCGGNTKQQLSVTFPLTCCASHTWLEARLPCEEMDS